MTATLAACALRTGLRVDVVDAPHATRRRLAELGIRPGARVEALATTAGGGRIVSVSGSRIAIDRSTAVGIAVSALADATAPAPIDPVVATAAPQFAPAPASAASDSVGAARR